MGIAQQLEDATESRYEGGETESDWDPYVVWRQQVSTAGTPATTSAGAADEAWNPFQVWADHVRTPSPGE
jgi:hypothetical protein